MEELCLQRGKNRPCWHLKTKSLLLPYQRLFFHSSWFTLQGVPGRASEVGMKQVRCLWELPRWSMKLTWAFPKLCHPHSGRVKSFSGLRYLSPHPKPVASVLLLSVTQSLRWVLWSSKSVPCFNPLRYAFFNTARLAEHRIQEHALGDHHFRSCCMQSVRPKDGNRYLAASVVTGERSVDVFLNNTSGLKSRYFSKHYLIYFFNINWRAPSMEIKTYCSPQNVLFVIHDF